MPLSDQERRSQLIGIPSALLQELYLLHGLMAEIAWRYAKCQVHHTSPFDQYIFWSTVSRLNNRMDENALVDVTSFVTSDHQPDGDNNPFLERQQQIADQIHDLEERCE